MPLLALFSEFPKDYLLPKHSLSDGSDLAQSFMKEYFDPSIFQKEECGIPLYKLIWAFRNSHAHTFYPYYKNTFNQKQISGAVDWLYLDNNKNGITIQQIESNFMGYKQSLYSIENDCFRIRPHILFVFFKEAVEEFIKKVENSDDIYTKFHQNYKRLAEYYNFEA